MTPTNAVKRIERVAWRIERIRDELKKLEREILQAAPGMTGDRTMHLLEHHQVMTVECHQASKWSPEGDAS